MNKIVASIALFWTVSAQYDIVLENVDKTSEFVYAANEFCAKDTLDCISEENPAFNVSFSSLTRNRGVYI